MFLDQICLNFMLDIPVDNLILIIGKQTVTSFSKNEILSRATCVIARKW